MTQTNPFHAYKLLSGLNIYLFEIPLLEAAQWPNYINNIHNGSAPPEGRLQRHCPRWSIHDRVGDGRCEQSHHHLPHAFNITGKEDWIHPSRAAVMANRRHLNDIKLTHIQDTDRYTKIRDKSLENPEIKIEIKPERNTKSKYIPYNFIQFDSILLWPHTRHDNNRSQNSILI